jgi:hypothetical protein
VVTAFFEIPRGLRSFSITALPSPDHFATLAVGMVVAFEVEAGPEELRATKITVMPGPHR